MALEMRVFCNFLLAFLKRFLNNSHYQPAARNGCWEPAIPLQLISEA
jgi:hypothetical protein